MTGNDIKRTRGALGLTQDQFALLLHVHRSMVSQWEREGTQPDEWQHNMLAELFKAATRFPDTARVVALLNEGKAATALKILLAD